MYNTIFVSCSLRFLSNCCMSGFATSYSNSNTLWCVTFLCVWKCLLATCLINICSSRASEYFFLCLMPWLFCSILIISDFYFGFRPVEIAPFSMSSPSVKAVFSCQIYPGYSPINCLGGSLISFIDCFSSWRGALLWEAIGFKKLCSCLLFCPVHTGK